MLKLGDIVWYPTKHYLPATQIPTDMEPIIVVHGTTSSRPLLAAGGLDIARRVFIEERLLHLLSNVNAFTTPIPIMLDPLKGFYGPLSSKDPGYLRYLGSNCRQARLEKLIRPGDL
ncbi:hypothetical protein ACG7TL_006298 [Trametes sanguinea]